MQVILNKKALEDLRKLFTTIYDDKPGVAHEYTKKIESYILLLESNPRMGKECQYKNLQKKCRVIYYDNYQIIYRIVNEELIRVLRILNTKQNYKG